MAYVTASASKHSHLDSTLWQQIFTRFHITVRISFRLLTICYWISCTMINSSNSRRSTRRKSLPKENENKNKIKEIIIFPAISFIFRLPFANVTNERWCKQNQRTESIACICTTFTIQLYDDAAFSCLRFINWCMECIMVHCTQWCTVMHSESTAICHRPYLSVSLSLRRSRSALNNLVG